LPALPAEESDVASVVGRCGAALGVLEVATAAYVVAQSGQPRVVAGRSGVRGYAAIRLEAAA
jgi:hypothetical protein